MTLSRRAAVLALAALPTLAHARAPGPRVQMWATYSGGETLDGPGGGGNPFATAFIEAMADPALDFPAACARIRQRTGEISRGFQAAEALGVERVRTWRFAPVPPRERRVALVLIFSDYRASDTAPSLPGAASDGLRVARAFETAGFVTRRLENPSRETLASGLEGFARLSSRADVAAIYATGHGVEVGGVQYVLRGDHVVAAGVAGLAQAARWTDIAAATQARRLNLTIWAGCRNNPFA
jgi:hypothetical protein